MKTNYNHLNDIRFSPYDYTHTLLQKCTSHILWNNNFMVTFLYYIQSILVTAARRIKYIKNYQNPL